MDDPRKPGSCPYTCRAGPKGILRREVGTALPFDRQTPRSGRPILVATSNSVVKTMQTVDAATIPEHEQTVDHWQDPSYLNALADHSD